MEKYKKANELGKTLQIEEKLAKIPLRELVARQVYKQKIPIWRTRMLPHRKKLGV
ncbi:hypothetical protein GCM10027035_17890 [Emticicia sediminis]